MNRAMEGKGTDGVLQASENTDYILAPDKEREFVSYMDMMFAVAMRYAKNDRRLAEDLTLEALRSALSSDEAAAQSSVWTKSLLLSHLRAAYKLHLTGSAPS
ncbi:MAG TPA: hypothetical protein PKY35_05745 [Candidatus Hydrogenedentes bacterium]|nr:hypothetical protein [Candidatus Hydrogenedentota bacterium]HPO85178.1 hypothetical protein [Candidatus Hydrogenedentota bacterium]